MLFNEVAGACPCGMCAHLRCAFIIEPHFIIEHYGIALLFFRQCNVQMNDLDIEAQVAAIRDTVFLIRIICLILFKGAPICYDLCVIIISYIICHITSLF